MNKSEARKIAAEQLTNHNHMVSGVWSVSEETAREVCETLGIYYENATIYVDEMSYENYHDELSDKYRTLKFVLGDKLFEKFEENDEFVEAFEEKFQNEYNGPEGSNNAYFWQYVLDNAR